MVRSVLVVRVLCVCKIVGTKECFWACTLYLITHFVYAGAVYDATESWSLALFAPAIALFILGTIIFIIYGTSEPQNFDRRALNKKFAWEKWLGGSLLHRE